MGSSLHGDWFSASLNSPTLPGAPMKEPLLRFPELQALLHSLTALRHRQALSVLLITLCLTGLTLGSVEQALAADRLAAALAWGLFGFVVLFYGINAAGWLLMRDALAAQRPGAGEDQDPLDALDAMRAALGQAHRTLAVLLVSLWPALPLLVLVLLGLWAARLPWIGPLLLALAAPLAVLGAGALAWLVFAIVAPLAGPAVWAGAGVREAAAWLRRQAWQRLLTASLLKLALVALVGGVGAILSAGLLLGARALTLLAWASGLPVPPQQMLAHLFGYTLKAMGQAGVPVTANAQAAALSAGGGVLVALLLVLPMLVYLRGCCAIYLALRARDQAVRS